MTGRGAGEDGDPRGVTTADAIPAAHVPFGPVTARDATNGVTGCGGSFGCGEPSGVTICDAIPAAHKPMRPMCARDAGGPCCAAAAGARAPPRERRPGRC